MTTLQFLTLWLVVVARSFVFGDFSHNEVDVLPVAYQFVNHGWLPGDWYLNLATSYRGLFNAIAGPLITAFGFKGAAIVGRLIVHTLYASAALVVLRTFRIRFAMGLLFLVLFLNNQTLVAGEWMTGGLETKSIAWPFVLFSLVAVVHRSWPAAFAAAGIALSFHVLVGLYAIACTVVGVLLSRRTQLPAWRDLKHVWLFCLTGGWGLYAVVRHLSGGNGGGDGWTTYVTFRVPHHVLPDAWSGGLWIAKLMVATVLIAAAYRRVSCPRIRFLAGYALASIGLFGTGLILWALGPTDLLRFYWFRFPDTILPFVSLMLIAYVMSRGFEFLSEKHEYRWIGGVEVGLVCLLAVLSASEIVVGLPELRGEAGWAASSEAPMFDWISVHTPREATFLIDPSQQTFYVRAERSVFVSWKHAPQSEREVREWFERLTVANGGDAPRGFGFRAARRIGVRLDELSVPQLERIRDDFDVDYYLGGAERQLPFPVAHRVGELVLYELK